MEWEANPRVLDYPGSPVRARTAVIAFTYLVAAVGLGCKTVGAPLHPESPAGTWYVVAEGETLATIAARQGVPLEDLIEINGFHRAESVVPGQLIFLLDARHLVGRGPDPMPERGTQGRTQPRASGLRRSGAERAAPFQWPLVDLRVTSQFGQRQGRMHEGIDLAAPPGTPVHAAAAGTVIYAGDAVRGYGNMIVLQHADDLLTVYAHNSLLLVKTGGRVDAGQLIARTGQSGHATGPHLHFEVRRAQVPRNPLEFLPEME